MEILIWGDNMKRQISISIFLAIIVIVLALIYVKVSNETKQNNDEITSEYTESNNSINISQVYTNYEFYIKEADGRLVVYDTKSQSIYTETGIEIHTLPAEIIEKLETGIFFETEAELYDFLESYSS